MQSTNGAIRQGREQSRRVRKRGSLDKPNAIFDINAYFDLEFYLNWVGF
jgi:hypothetical protein